MNRQKKNTTMRNAQGFEVCQWDIAFGIQKAELAIEKKVIALLAAIRAKVKTEPKKY